MALSRGQCPIGKGLVEKQDESAGCQADHALGCLDDGAVLTDCRDSDLHLCLDSLGDRCSFLVQRRFIQPAAEESVSRRSV